MRADRLVIGQLVTAPGPYPEASAVPPQRSLALCREPLEHQFACRKQWIGRIQYDLICSGLGVLRLAAAVRLGMLLFLATAATAAGAVLHRPRLVDYLYNVELADIFFHCLTRSLKSLPCFFGMSRTTSRPASVQRCAHSAAAFSPVPESS